MDLSKYQQGILAFVRNGKGHGLVEAVAGSGKTTTLVEVMKAILAERPTARVGFFAFNKHIATELARKAPPGAAVSTIHSLGFGAVKRGLGRVEVDSYKMRGIVETVMGNGPEAAEARTAAARLADLIRITLTDAADAAAVGDLIDTYEIEANGDREWIIESMPRALEIDVEMARAGSVDFTDMIWLPHRLDLTPDRYDWVLVDEAQDLSAAQRNLILKAVRPGGRVLAVGDRRQAIYGFAGADTRSIETLVETLGATVLPLSICYRCPSSHIALAQSIVPQIEARPDAPKGTVEQTHINRVVPQLADGDLVICRVNAPLAEIALTLIRRGQKAVIRGRDISGNLLTLIKRGGRGHGDNLEKLFTKLHDYVAREAAKLSKARKDSQAVALTDKLSTIIALADGLQTVKGLEDRIRSIFADEEGGVICSSIHRAKGLEAKRVLFYGPEICPHPKAASEEAMAQEMNLRYVALTRAKEVLWMAEIPRNRND